MENDDSQITPLARNIKKVRSKEAMVLSRLKRRLFKHIWLMRIVIAAGFFAVLTLTFFVVWFILNSFGFGRYTNLAKNFLFTPAGTVASLSGRTNILLMGKGGAGHEAPDLTDTMMFISIPHEGGELVIISLPRDIWIEELRAKLNSAYYWGNQKTSGGGLILAKSAVEEIVGVPVHYAAVLDFSGLKSVIDGLGGVEVEVENGFVDEKYPIVGKENDLCAGDKTYACRWETIKFEAGLRVMDGDTALKFVRSRNAQGDEGTDFARAARQQKVIEAIQKKILSREVILSPQKIRELLDLFTQIVETDLSESAEAVLARKIWDSRQNKKSYVLGEDFLDNPPIGVKYDYLYVFVPKTGNWDQVHEWVNSFLTR